jgi:hypothetical protein
VAVSMAKCTWRKIGCQGGCTGGELDQVGHRQLGLQYILCRQQRFFFPLNSPFPWRIQSVFNDFIDLTIGLQRTLFTAEMFPFRQHFNAHKSTFWHYFDGL